jgi:Imidazoleglycerol-phosphate synthase
MIKRIFSCLDVRNGRVVKGINFISLVDARDPPEQAKFYSEDGANEICFLYITASNENRDTILDVVKKTSAHCFVPLTVEGWSKKYRRYFKFIKFRCR